MRRESLSQVMDLHIPIGAPWKDARTVLRLFTTLFISKSPFPRREGVNIFFDEYSQSWYPDESSYRKVNLGLDWIFDIRLTKFWFDNRTLITKPDRSTKIDRFIHKRVIKNILFMTKWSRLVTRQMYDSGPDIEYIYTFIEIGCVIIKKYYFRFGYSIRSAYI
jgi:hypothetical protein